MLLFSCLVFAFMYFEALQFTYLNAEIVFTLLKNKKIRYGLTFCQRENKIGYAGGTQNKGFHL